MNIKELTEKEIHVANKTKTEKNVFNLTHNKRNTK